MSNDDDPQQWAKDCIEASNGAFRDDVRLFNDVELNFIMDMRKKTAVHGRLTERQRDWLRDLWKRACESPY